MLHACQKGSSWSNREDVSCKDTENHVKVVCIPAGSLGIHICISSIAIWLLNYSPHRDLSHALLEVDADLHE